MAVSRSRVFLDVSIGTEPAGRLVIELFVDKAPKTCENFRALCTGSKPPLSYKASPFHRVIDEFMIQGGDITKGNGTGGDSIYGGEFADENIGWRPIDKEGLVCMANRGKDTNSSQFFITLAPCPHLNAKHTLFGHIVSGQETMTRIAKVDVDKDDRPLVPVLITRCGELERRGSSNNNNNNNKKKPKGDRNDVDSVPAATSTSRGRRKRRRSGSPSRSPSPSRGHTRRSGSRHRRPHRKHRYTCDRSSSRDSSRRPRREEEEEGEQKGRRRRRSDASPDHNLRGRMRRRSRSRSRTHPVVNEEEEDGSA
ncbi:hypothetical protein LTS18_014086, partial [Coniosporium uncinatum]